MLFLLETNTHVIDVGDLNLKFKFRDDSIEKCF